MKKLTIFLFFILLSIFSWFSFASYDLKISEVYFDWSQEWIEVVNIWSSSFSWILTLSGVWATNQNINLNIDPWEIKVISESFNYFLNNSQINFFWWTFSLNDKNLLNIEILSWSDLLDYLNFDLTSTPPNKNSIQKDLSWSIFFTNQNQIYNTFHSFRANPWISLITWNFDTIERNDYKLSNLSTWLKITEIYPKWDYEWIEITNFGNFDYNWIITIVWFGNNKDIWTWNIFITWWDVLVLKHPNVTYISNNVNQISIMPTWRILSDTQRISLSLFNWNNTNTWNLFDIYYTENTFLNKSSHLYFDSINLIQQDSHSCSYNTNDPSLTINPWVVVNSSCVQFYPIVIPPSDPECSGKIYFSELHKNDWYVDDYIEIKSEWLFSWNFKISGSIIWNVVNIDKYMSTWQHFLFSKNTISDYFVSSFWWFSSLMWNLEIYWSWYLCDSIHFDVNLQQTWQSLYTDWTFWTWTPWIPRGYINLLPIQEKTIIQNVTIPFTQSDCQSNFPNTCFDNSLCPITTWTTNCPVCQTCSSCNCGWWSSYSCPSASDICPSRSPYLNLLWTCNLTWSNNTYNTWNNNLNLSWNIENTWNNNTNLTWNDNVQNLSNISFLKIVDIIYDPEWSDTNNEVVVLKSLVDYDLDLNLFRLHSLNRTTKNKINWNILWSGKIWYFTWNYSFPNITSSFSWNCINLIQNEDSKILDTFCYPQIGTNEQELTWWNNTWTNIWNTWWQINTWDANFTWINFETLSWEDENIVAWVFVDYRNFVIKIKDLIYDPKVQWWNEESIVLELITWANEIIVSNLRIRKNENKTYNTLTSNIVFDWNLQKTSWDKLKVYEPLRFVKNFGFPNTNENYIYLYYKTWTVNDYFLYDTYFYNADKEESEQAEEYENDEIDQNIIKIKEIVYDPPWSDTNNESITFELINWQYVDMSKLRIRINNSNKTLNWILTNGQKLTITKTFGMSNTKDSCVELINPKTYHIFDTMCYSIPKENTWNIESTWEYVDLENIKIKITDIIYDPDGNDELNESITLNYLNWVTWINLNNFNLIVNTTKKSMKYFGDIEIWQTKTRSWTFGFPNTKQTCVSLVKWEYIFDTYCYNPLIKDESEELEKENKVEIKIFNIIYDPEWSDKWNEEITIKYLNWNTWLDLTNFSMKINDKNKSMKDFWTINIWEQKTYKWDFGFPNKSDTCVDIFKKDILYDKYCYSPIDKEELKIEEIEVENIEQEIDKLEIPRISISSVLPNPKWADNSKEFVWLTLLEHSQKNLKIDKNYTLKIKDKNINLSGNFLSLNKETKIYNISLPNSATCITLYYMDIKLDDLCYPEAKDDIIYTKWTSFRQPLTEEEKYLLSKLTIKTENNQLCVYYNWLKISCRNLKISKVDNLETLKLKLAKNYIWIYKNLIYNNRPTFWRYWQVGQYDYVYNFALLNLDQDKLFEPNIEIDWVSVSILDIESQYDLIYNRSSFDRKVQKIWNIIWGKRWYDIWSNYFKKSKIKDDL